MKTIILSLFIVLAVAACNQNASNSDSAAYITLLGNDTLAVEQFEKTENSIQAEVILRTPEISFTSYELELGETGGIQKMVQRSHSPEEGFAGDGEVVQTIRNVNDSLVVEPVTGNRPQRQAVLYEKGALPFIDMVHWPFEVAFNNAAESSQDSISQPLLTGPRLSTFIIAKISEDSMTIRHPFRGVMGVDVNSNGDLVHLDAGLTTRKLQVHRVPELDIDALGERFASMDQSGNPFGELSGAESEDFSFKGAGFHVEYGSPLKRGRTIFGGIVPWGDRWRTGANRATHFSTTRDLVIGDLNVPAGEYTLFTIPEPHGGTLIINKQTGQNGQSYDESRDLGRVPMEISDQPGVTEQFTIEVEETNTGGVLKLIWDRTVFSVDFEIR